MEIPSSISAKNVVVAERVGSIAIDASLERLSNGLGSPADLRAVENAMIAGDLSSVTINAQQIDELHYHTQVFKGPSAVSVGKVLAKLQRQIEADSDKSAQKAYLEALRQLLSKTSYRLDKAVQPQHFVPLTAQLRHAGADEAHGIEDLTQITFRVLDGTDKALAIVGRPGSGKSSFLRHMAALAWDDPQAAGLPRRYLPLLVQFRHLAVSEGAGIEERLWLAVRKARDLAIIESEPAKGFMARWAKRFDAPWLVFVDGLDELAEHDRNDALDWLVNVLTAMPTLRLVISSRAAELFDYSALHDRCAILSLTPINADAWQQIATDLLGSKDAIAFAAAVDEQLSEVDLSTPLLATIAALVYKEDGELPRNRTALYHRFVDHSIKQAERQGLNDALPQEAQGLAVVLLEGLALAALKSDEPATPAAVSSWISDELRGLRPNLTPAVCLGVAERASEVLVGRSGLTMPGPEIGWGHGTVRDFLAARAVVRKFSPTNPEAAQQIRKWRDERWRNAILFMFGLWGDGWPHRNSTARGATRALDTAIFKILYGEEYLPTQTSIWTRIFHKFRPAPERGKPEKASLIMASEAMAECDCASEPVQREIFQFLCSSESALSYGFCQRLFQPRGDELDAILRFQKNGDLVPLFAPYLTSRVRHALTSSMWEEKSSSAGVALLCKLNLVEQLREIALDESIPASRLIQGLARAAVLEGPEIPQAIVADMARSRSLSQECLLRTWVDSSEIPEFIRQALRDMTTMQ